MPFLKEETVPTGFNLYCMLDTVLTHENGETIISAPIYGNMETGEFFTYLKFDTGETIIAKGESAQKMSEKMSEKIGEAIAKGARFDPK